MKLLVEGQYATIHTPFVLHEGKVYFWGSNRAEFDKNLQKMLLFRKSDDFFGLCSEKVATFLDYVPKKFGGLKKK